MKGSCRNKLAECKDPPAARAHILTSTTVLLSHDFRHRIRMSMFLPSKFGDLAFKVNIIGMFVSVLYGGLVYTSYPWMLFSPRGRLRK